MLRSRKSQVVAGAVAALAVAGGGAAFAADKLSPREESQAVLNDAAQQLGIEPSRLSAALKQALKNRVDAAVEDGRLTEEQGVELKERIDAGEVPFFGVGRSFHKHFHGPFHAKLEAAAEYLGMTQAQLEDALEDGKTLAQVAKDKGKAVDGLVDALVEGAEQKLQDAVEAGRLTEAEKSEMLDGLRDRITDLVNGRFPRLPRPQFHRDGPRFEERPAFVF